MCEKPGQELSNGFCYDACPANYTGIGGLCYRNCPTNYTDHGQACEPSSVLRAPVNSFTSPCQEGQIDQNGNCFEPRVYSFYNKVSGCGCIRKYKKDRVQCPQGYVQYNTQCLPECPKGYKDVKDPNGTIVSMYCLEDCPLKDNSKNERWTKIGNLCVKEVLSRTKHKLASTSFNGSLKSIPTFGIPKTMVSYLSSQASGSNMLGRNRVGQSVGAGQSSWSKAISDSTNWLSLLSDPLSLLIIVGGLFIVIFAGPKLFPLLGSALGYIFQGFGFLAGAVEKTGGEIIQSTGEILEATTKVATNAVKEASNKITEKKTVQQLDTIRKAQEALNLAQQNYNQAQMY
jgi:hypothetical protein